MKIESIVTQDDERENFCKSVLHKMFEERRKHDILTEIDFLKLY